MVAASSLLFGGGAPPSQRPERTLPKIPHHGLAARLSPQVLVSKIEEANCTDSAPSRYNKQHVLPASMPSTAGRSEGVAQKVRTLLYQKDHVNTPRLLDSLLVACGTRDHGHTAGSAVPPLGFAGAAVGDSISSGASTPPVSSPRHGPRGCGPKDLAPAQLSDLVNVVPDVGGPTCKRRNDFQRKVGTFLKSPQSGLNRASGQSEGSSLRTRHLQASFLHTQTDIEARLFELDEHLYVRSIDTPISTNAASADTFWRRKSEVSEAEDKQHEELPEKHVMNELFDAYKNSSISMIAMKPVATARGGVKGDDSQSVTQSHAASREEVLLTCELLNFHRWLCGLAPVKLNSDCNKACEILSQALLARTECFLKRTSPQVQNVVNFGKLLAAFMGTPGRTIVLHKETSLVSSVGQCITSSHMTGRRGRPVATIQGSKASSSRGRPASGSAPPWPLQGGLASLPPEQLALINEARERAARAGAQWRSHPDSATRHDDDFSQLRERRRLRLDELPPILHSMQIFWALTEKAALLQKRCAQGTPRGADPRGHGISPVLPRPLAKSPGKTRQVAWDFDKAQKELDKVRARSVFWGDLDGVVTFRRYLLNPAMRSFGASRLYDTCVLWTGTTAGRMIQPANTASNLPGSAAPGPLSQVSPPSGVRYTNQPVLAVEEGTPEFICFPPTGLFPHELLLGGVPIWTIMPDSRRFQPTQSMQVRMWRVRIEGLTAERLEEVDATSVSSDCSPKGNPFCILFRPALSRIADGDQFEVELSGLRGREPRRHFFHEFRSLRSGQSDHHLLDEAAKLRAALDDPSLWCEPLTTVPSTTGDPSCMLLQVPKAPPPGEPVSPRGRTQSQDAEAEVAIELPELGLVSHPSRTFTTESVDVTISLRCAGASALRAQLFLDRVSGAEEIPRATVVMKVQDHFIVRVKLPMAHCKFELTFQVALHTLPDTLLDHPFKYSITTSETCQNLLISTEHPLKDKFGYAPQAASQLHGVSIIAPIEHRVRAGYRYFLVHFDPGSLCRERPRSHAADPGAERQVSTLFRERLLRKEGCLSPGGILGDLVVDPTRGSLITGPAVAAENPPEGGAPRQDTLGLQNGGAKPQGGGAMSFRRRMSSLLSDHDPGSRREGGSKSTLADTREGSKSAHQDPQQGSKLAHGRVPDSLRNSKSSLQAQDEPPKQEHAMVPIVSTLQHILAERLEPIIQDVSDAFHIDIALFKPQSHTQRYVLRLQQRSDFPELYDGVLFFADHDVGGRVEMFLRFPGEAETCSPLKIGEWIIIRREEHFPIGF